MSSNSNSEKNDPFPEFQDKPTSDTDEMVFDDLFQQSPAKPSDTEGENFLHAEKADDDSLWAVEPDRKTASQEPLEARTESSDADKEASAVQEMEDISDVLGDLAAEEEKLKGGASEQLEQNDDLWDADETSSDVPLFEEFADDLAEIEQKKAEEHKPRPTEPVSTPLIEEVTEGQADTVGDGPVAGQVSDVREENVVSISTGIALAGIAGSVLLSVAAVFVFWQLSDVPTVPAPPALSRVEAPQDAAQAHQDILSKELGKRPDTSVEPRGGESTKSVQGERITLAPFLIPATQHGQPVFLSLQVDLLCENDEIEAGLLRKEAWLRDSIYRELKGLEIGSNDLNPFLLHYKTPLIQRINTDIAPYAVQDVILIGSILK